MKIVHIGLLSSYTEGMLYQDNMLVHFNRLDGHDVTFITDTRCYQDGKLVEVPEEDRILDNGARLIRLKYDFLINQFISNKIQKVKRLYSILYALQPEVIMYHGVCGYELMNVAKYVKECPGVLFYVDSHEDFYNTARTFLAKLCYKFIHGYFVKNALPDIKKILYINYDTANYLRIMYHIPENKMDFFPLGGIIVPYEMQNIKRNEIIKKYNLPHDAIICAHSGKMDREKNTKELLEAFCDIKNERFRMFVFGTIPDNQKEIIMPLIESDNRIYFLGWKENEEIVDILAGVDLYCQPGTMSATFAMALCAGCATMIYPYGSYEHFIGKDTFYCDGTVESIHSILNTIIEDTSMLLNIKERAFLMAQKYLDYRVLAQKYLM